MFMENEIKSELVTQPVEKIKDNWFFIRNSAGEASVSVTLLVISFVVTTILYVASALGKIGPVTLRPFDVGATSVYFIPIISLYLGRRFTDKKFGE